MPVNGLTGGFDGFGAAGKDVGDAADPGTGKEALQEASRERVRSVTDASDARANDAAGGGANPASGYSLIAATSLEDAHAKARGCPLLKNGGSIEIAEAFDM